MSSILSHLKNWLTDWPDTDCVPKTLQLTNQWQANKRKVCLYMYICYNIAHLNHFCARETRKKKKNKFNTLKHKCQRGCLLDLTTFHNSFLRYLFTSIFLSNKCNPSDTMELAWQYIVCICSYWFSIINA